MKKKKQTEPPVAACARTFPMRFWIFMRDRAQRPERLIPLLTCLVWYVLLVICYPLPDTMSDSMGYVEFAAKNEFTFFRPFGYSGFLQFVAFFSSAIQAVPFMQMLFYLVVTMLLLMVLRYYFPVRRRWLRLTLDIALTLHPAALCMTSMLMSDIVFCLLIHLLFVFIIVYLHERRWWMYGLFLLTFWCVLFVRYSAMFFPLAFVPMLLLLNKRTGWLLVAAMGVVWMLFHENICDHMEETGYAKHQFSTGFDGWQLANNAIHILPHIERDSIRFEDKELQNLHLFLGLRTDSITVATGNGRRATAAFMWQNRYPLKQYLGYRMTLKMDAGKSYGYLWIELGGLFSRYGRWLILHYPGQFFRWYLKPNLKQVFLPDQYDIFGKYREVSVEGTYLPAWFGLPDDLTLQARHDFMPRLAPWLARYELVTWLLWLAAAVLWLVRRKACTVSRECRWVMWLLVLFAFVYYATTTFAAPVVLRYWLPMNMCKWAFIWLVCHLLVEKKNIALK